MDLAFAAGSHPDAANLTWVHVTVFVPAVGVGEITPRVSNVIPRDTTLPHSEHCRAQPPHHPESGPLLRDRRVRAKTLGPGGFFLRWAAGVVHIGADA